MENINYNNKLNAGQFYTAFDTLSGMNAKKDLVNVNLNEKLNLLEQFVEWIKGFVCEETKISPDKINLKIVANNINNFVINNKEHLTILATNQNKEIFNKLVNNIEDLKDRFVEKHKNEQLIETTEIFKKLTAALSELKNMQQIR